MHFLNLQSAHTLTEDPDSLKPWKHTLSSPYNPDLGAQVNQRVQRLNSLEGRASQPSKAETNEYPGGLLTPTSPFFPDGHYSTLYSPEYVYAGPEPAVHKFEY